MTSTIKVNTIQNTCGADIIKESSNTITLGASGDTVTLASGASQTGFGRTGTVDWQTTIKTGDFTAVSGEGYFINTTSGVITMTLPSSPSAGDIVSFSDYAGNFDTNKLTIARNGSPIGGNAIDAEVTTEGVAATLVYSDSTKGWLVTESGLQSDVPGPAFVAATGGTVTTVCTNFKVHTFTGPGTFSVTSAGNSAGSNTVSYLVIAGGGAGGFSATGDAGGGGGAGGFREGLGLNDSYTGSPLRASTGVPVSVTNFPIVVGGGGTAQPQSTQNGDGSNSTFSSITSAGGGAGAQGNQGPQRIGRDGGSGGGGANGTDAVGGSGNTPSVSPPQGNNGGDGLEVNHGPGPNFYGGGGGGAGAVGADAAPPGSGPGGCGATSSINSTPTTRAGGGGGGQAPSRSPSGAGNPGPGGGGGVGSAGTANTGGGGGSGQGPSNGANGGSGIVIIRYKFQ